MVTLVFVYMAMHCGCMPWCLLKYLSVGLWNRVAVVCVKRIELKEILLFFPHFGVRIPIYFLLFSHCHFYFPIFWVSFVTWNPVNGNPAISHGWLLNTGSTVLPRLTLKGHYCDIFSYELFLIPKARFLFFPIGWGQLQN